MAETERAAIRVVGNSPGARQPTKVSIGSMRRLPSEKLSPSAPSLRVNYPSSPPTPTPSPPSSATPMGRPSYRPGTAAQTSAGSTPLGGPSTIRRATSTQTVLPAQTLSRTPARNTPSSHGSGPTLGPVIVPVRALSGSIDTTGKRRALGYAGVMPQ